MVYNKGMKQEEEKKENLPEKRKKEIPYRSYLPSAFIMASLPLRDVKSSVFERKYNGISMMITGSPKVPYGSYGRLVLSLLTTHAVVDERRENGSVLISYEYEKDFLTELKAPKTRGAEFREQLDFFSSSSFIFQAKVKRRIQKSLFEDFAGEEGDFEVTMFKSGNIPFIRTLQYMRIEDENVSPGKAGRSFTIELSSDFVQFCKDHSVPIDYTIYSKIKNATGKDLYAWFVYRNNSLQDGEEIFIPKETLVGQFMPVKNEANFAAQLNTNYQYLLERIEEIKEYYPELDVRKVKEGLGIRLIKSPALIKSDDRRYMLITSQIQ